MTIFMVLVTESVKIQEDGLDEGRRRLSQIPMLSLL